MISFMILSLFQSRFLEYNIWFQNTGGTGTPVHQDAGKAVRRQWQRCFGCRRGRYLCRRLLLRHVSGDRCQGVK